MDEGDNIQDIRDAVRRGKLTQPFRAAAVNAAIGIDYAGNFMAKHCDQRSDKSFTWLFDRVERGLYRLNQAQQAILTAGR